MEDSSTSNNDFEVVRNQAYSSSREIEALNVQETATMQEIPQPGLKNKSTIISWKKIILSCWKNHGINFSIFLLLAYGLLSTTAIIVAFTLISDLKSTQSSQQDMLLSMLSVQDTRQQKSQECANIRNDIRQCTCVACGEMGILPINPARSCDSLPRSCLSGYYWVKTSNGSIVRVYCDMARTCGEITGGWTRIAHLDMSNSSHQCPEGLVLSTDSNLRTCRRESNTASCASVTFASSSVEYSRVCGQVIAYQFASPDAFSVENFGRIARRTIDDPYVDGVSLTHGNPREHIWTFAASLSESSPYHSTICSCINDRLFMNSTTATPPPDFVKENYFCDTALSNETLFPSILHFGDPLWDGAGCGPLSTCCLFNTPPWFFRELPHSTTNDIEMRLCGDQSSADEDTPIEKLDIFVQ